LNQNIQALVLSEINHGGKNQILDKKYTCPNLNHSAHLLFLSNLLCFFFVSQSTVWLKK